MSRHSNLPDPPPTRADAERYEGEIRRIADEVRRKNAESERESITINIRGGVHPPEALATHAAIGEMVGRWNRERAEKDTVMVLMDVADMWACMPNTTEMLRRAIALTQSPHGRRHIARVARETTFRRVMGFVAEFARLQVTYDAASLSRPGLTRGDWLAMRGGR